MRCDNCGEDSGVARYCNTCILPMSMTAHTKALKIDIDKYNEMYKNRLDNKCKTCKTYLRLGMFNSLMRHIKEEHVEVSDEPRR